MPTHNAVVLSALLPAYGMKRYIDLEPVQVSAANASTMLGVLRHSDILLFHIPEDTTSVEAPVLGFVARRK